MSSLIESQEKFVIGRFKEMEIALTKNDRKYLQTGVTLISYIKKVYKEYEYYPDSVKYLMIAQRFEKDRFYEQIKQRYHAKGSQFIDFLKGSLEENFVKATEQANSMLNTDYTGEYEESPMLEDFKKKSLLQGHGLAVLIALLVSQKKQVDEISVQITIQVQRDAYTATRLARTETASTLNQASTDVYQKAGVQKVKWTNAPEMIQFAQVKGKTVTRVCPRCEKYAIGGVNSDGVYPINRLPAPCPAHPNCRCTLVPII